MFKEDFSKLMELLFLENAQDALYELKLSQNAMNKVKCCPAVPLYSGVVNNLN
jgi:hypothetical protein